MTADTSLLPMPDAASWVARMPKAELHMHLEGAIAPEQMLAMAARNGIALPYPDAQALRAAYDFRDLQSFLDILYIGNSVLQTREDFREMTLGYLRRAHAQNVLHAEMFISPQAHLSRGVAFAAMFDGIFAAMDEATTELGISAGLIMGFQRHRSEAEAFEVIELARPYRERLLGVGLGATEVGNPPAKFERAFAQCRALGWHCVAHAGEEGPPEYIAQAIDVLRVERIDHGVRCIEDPALVRRLADLAMPLTVCPLSNVKLAVFPELRAHNLKLLLQQGVRVTVNSDNPEQFGGYVNENLQACQQALELSENELFTLARNSFDSSFIDAARKQDHCAQLDAFRATLPAPASTH